MNDDKVKTAKKALQKLKHHYISFHLIDENNYYFKELFTPSTVSKRCDQCKMGFRNYMVKKNHNFIHHYGHVGGARTQLPMNVPHQRKIKQYTIHFDQHKNFYDFFDEGIVDKFLKSVYECFFA